MSALVVFPLARRSVFVRKHACRMATLSATAAESHLRRMLDVQRDVMGRRGVPSEEVARQLRSLELAIRAELWRCVFSPGGAA